MKDSSVSDSKVGASAYEPFAEWFVRNYPPDCIISRPEWHAPKIYRAATFELLKQRDELAEAMSNLLTSFRQHEVNTGMPLLNGPLKAEVERANATVAKLDTDSTKGSKR